MQQNYRQFLLTASSDIDFISFGEYYENEYIKTVESTRPRANMADDEQAIVLACTSLVVFMLLGYTYTNPILSVKWNKEMYTLIN